MNLITFSYRPPRLLIGMALLFCGWMVDQPVMFLMAAVAVESSRWFGRRFDLNDNSFARAWQLGWIAGLVVFVSMWLNDVSYTRILRFSGLLPLFLVPLVALEAYSKQQTTPLTTFSFIARRKRKGDLAAGRPVEDKRISVGYPFLIVVLVAAGTTSSRYYFVGVAIFVAISLWAQARQAFRRWGSLAVFLIICSFLAGGAAKTVYDLRRVFRSGDHLALMYGRQLSPKFHQTGVGRIHHLKQSKRVIWHVRVEEGIQPQLLREATYSSYQRGMWRNPSTLDFQGMVSLPGQDWSWGFPIGDAGETLPTSGRGSSRLRIRGDVDRNSVLAMPDNATQLNDLVTFEVSVNQMGCVRLDEPKQTVVDYLVEHGSHRGIESTPNAWDLEIPEGEMTGIQAFVDSRELRGLPIDELIARLRKIFIEEYTYSLDIRHEDVGDGKIGRDSGLSYFLNQSHKGYCEYFAGATALVLRECGYPTRYAIGFSVAEQDGEDAFVLRGVHAHAWVRAYDGTSWRNVDLTPPGWLEEDNDLPWVQGIFDTFYDIRQRVTLWRLQGGNAATVNRILIGIISLMVLVVSARIWWLHRKGLLRSSDSGGQRPGKRIKELRKIESQLIRHIGPRRRGEPVTAWLRRFAVFFPAAKDEVGRLVELYEFRRFSPDGHLYEAELSAQIGKIRAYFREWNQQIKSR